MLANNIITHERHLFFNMLLLRSILTIIKKNNKFLSFNIFIENQEVI